MVFLTCSFTSSTASTVYWCCDTGFCRPLEHSSSYCCSFGDAALRSGLHDHKRLLSSILAKLLQVIDLPKVIQGVEVKYQHLPQKWITSLLWYLNFRTMLRLYCKYFTGNCSISVISNALWEEHSSLMKGWEGRRELISQRNRLSCLYEICRWVFPKYNHSQADRYWDRQNWVIHSKGLRFHGLQVLKWLLQRLGSDESSNQTSFPLHLKNSMRLYKHYLSD